MSREQAYICENCGFGSKADNCVKCGKWRGSSSFPALVCDNCVYASKKDECVKCGKYMGSGVTRVRAYLAIIVDMVQKVNIAINVVDK